MSGSGKGLLGLWLYRSGEQEWAVKEGSPVHHHEPLVVGRWSPCASAETKPVPLQVREEAQTGNSETMSMADKTSIIFTLNNQVGGLARALQVFQELGINVLHLELQNNNAHVDQVTFRSPLPASIFIN